MAEKSFGVKEINLIGASGTPTIESPNNLNLKAVNVAISTNVSIGGTLTVSGSVSVGGTLTYEDVTNIDVIGIATFRDNVKIDEDKELTFDGSDGGKIVADGSNFIIEGTNSTGGTYIRGGNELILSGGQVGSHQTTVRIDKSSGNGFVELYYGGNKKLETTSTGVDVTGAVTATSFVKSGGTSSQYLMADGSTTTSGGGGGGSGISTISGVVNIANDLDVDGHTNLDNVSIAGITTFSDHIYAGRIYLGGSNGKYMQAGSNFELQMSGGVDMIFSVNTGGGTSGDIRLQRGSGTDSLVVNGSGGVNVTGTLSATTFSGSGSNLTNLPAGQLSGSLPSISGANLTNLPSPSPTNSDIQGMWTIGGNTSGYTFTGPGQDGSDQNPDIFLVRGQRYRFVNSTGNGHPFEFRNFDNDADYTDGITGPQNGTQDFNVQHDAPSALKYRCTIHTGSMLGNIYIIGGRRGVIASAFQPSSSSDNASFVNQIPEWATKITILLHRVSFTGGDNMKIRLRDNTSTYTSGYYSYTANATASYTNSSTDSFIIGMTSGSQESSGKIEIEKVDNLYWTETHMITTGNLNIRHGAGQLTMSSGTIDGIIIQSASGDNYDGNSRISVYFE